MKQGMQSNLPSSKGQEEANMSDIVADLESSESIYFQQKFTRSLSDNVQLVLPMRFVQEHGYKIDKWVILRARTPSGTSSRPWAVQLKIYKKVDGTRDVRFVGGWEAFATHNQLKEGDSLIFLLSRGGARSEFEVYVFREIGGSFSLLELWDSSSDEEDYIVDSVKNNTNLSVPDSGNNIVPSPGLSHRQDEFAKTLKGNVGDGKAPGFQITEHLENHCEFPSFHKRLTASSIQRSNGIPNSGQFEFPLKFVSTYGEHFQPSIQLQGVYEESPVYLVAVRRYKGRGDAKQNAVLRLGIKEHDWSAFVKENDLKKGQKLQFSLTADSYFVVRIV